MLRFYEKVAGSFVGALEHAVNALIPADFEVIS